MEVNDPPNPLIGTLILSQIWRNLVLHMREQTEFIESLDVCVITTEGGDWVERELASDKARIQDRVMFESYKRVTCTTVATGEYADGSLAMTVESNETSVASIRFVYGTTLLNAGETGGTHYVEIVRPTHRGSDTDTVHRIREVATTDRLG